MSVTVDEQSVEIEHARASDHELPRVFDLLTECIDDLKENFAGFMLAGLGMYLAVLALVTVGMGLFVVGMLPGIIIESEALLFTGMFGGLGAYLLLVILVSAPLHAGMTRAMWKHVQDGEPLGFTSVFTNMREDIGRVLAYSFLTTALALVGMMFCYVPGLLVGIFTALGLPAIIVHRLGALDALKLSAGHTKQNLGWHLGFWGLGFAILFVAQNIPLIGPMLGSGLYASYHLRGYRRVFGTGALPRGYLVRA